MFKLPRGEPSSLEYLRIAAINAAMEIDSYSSGKGKGFEYCQKMGEFFRQYLPEEKDSFSNRVKFPYLILKRVLEKDSDTKIEEFDDLGLQMSLLSLELGSMPPEDSSRNKDLVKLLCNFSVKLLDENSYRFERRHLNGRYTFG
ncbi:MAG: hypothetical protein WDZ77_03115 [Candidatus Pacearchaeota archaeon]